MSKKDSLRSNYYLKLEYSFIFALIILLSFFYFFESKLFLKTSSSHLYEYPIIIVSYSRSRYLSNFKNKPLKAIISIPA